jgi:hypothetical protein
MTKTDVKSGTNKLELSSTASGTKTTILKNGLVGIDYR